MFSRQLNNASKLWLCIGTTASLLFVSGVSFSADKEDPLTGDDIAIAKGFIRCETFYKHYYESLRHSNPNALSALPKLPSAIRFQRIAAESLVGESKAKSLYGENLESQLLEFTAAASGNNWSSYAKKMSAECSKLASDNDNERMNRKIRRHMDLKGIKDPFQTEKE
jgi:hypothetical protein